MTAASRSLATALWRARFASGLLRPNYTTSSDTTLRGDSRRAPMAPEQALSSWVASLRARASGVAAIDARTMARLLVRNAI